MMPDLSVGLGISKWDNSLLTLIEQLCSGALHIPNTDAKQHEPPINFIYELYLNTRMYKNDTDMTEEDQSVLRVPT